MLGTRRIGVPLMGLVLLCSAACDRASTQRADASPSPSTSAPMTWAQVCVRDVTYWIDEALAKKKDLGYDYQHMGLTAEVYDILRVVQPKALAEQRRAGDEAAKALARAEATAPCEQAGAKRASASPTSRGGWPG